MVQDTIRVIGAPVDLGASRRGTDMGPSAMRAAHLHTRLRELGYRVQDAGNVYAPEMEEKDEDPAGEAENLKFLPEILDACRMLADKVEKAVADGTTPLILGGDHSIAIGTQAGLARRTTKRGLLWFDAHADINTHKTSPSGNIHGMPVSAILGLGDAALADFDRKGPKIDPARVCIIGLRSVDNAEAVILEASGVTYYTMRDIDERGMRRVIDEAVGIAAKGGDRDAVHLSFDLDAVDPQWAPGTGTTVPGGLTYREAHLAMEMLADADVLGSLEFVEVNPLLDVGNQTGKFAVGLIASALGKAIVQG